MIQVKACNDTLSMLGFGAMRLPQTPNGEIDQVALEEMVTYFMEQGVNYFDTAYPYHDGVSERVLAKALKAYPRDSYRLATKYPGHQIAETYNPAEIFEEQLKKCDVEYFDYYLLHNVYENSIQVYTDEKWGILDYFKEQKRLGRIKHLGFSTHAGVETLTKFLDYAGDSMEFCQIQLNYLDWTLQDAKTKCEILNERNIPIWVMEPVRGGRLAQLTEEEQAVLLQHDAENSAASWAFRFFQDIEGVSVVLSGMSNMDQAIDNVKAFSKPWPLSDDEKQVLLSLAEGMKDSVPCTACRYCCDDCPQGLDIPFLLGVYNEIRFSPAVVVAMRLEGLAEDKQPSACTACGTCTQICPQGIDIPVHMADLAKKLEEIPSWKEICKQRAEAQK